MTTRNVNTDKNWYLQHQQSRQKGDNSFVDLPDVAQKNKTQNMTDSVKIWKSK